MFQIHSLWSTTLAPQIQQGAQTLADKHVVFTATVPESYSFVSKHVDFVSETDFRNK